MIYGYIQEYPGRYHVYASPDGASRAVAGDHRVRAIGEVWRVGSKWIAGILTDSLITGIGRTRDQAVEDCYRQVGGRG